MSRTSINRVSVSTNGNDVVLVTLLGGSKDVPGCAVLHLSINHEIGVNGTGPHLGKDGLAVLLADANDGNIWANVALGSAQSTTELTRAIVVDNSANGLVGTGASGLGTKVAGATLDEGDLALDVGGEVALVKY